MVGEKSGQDREAVAEIAFHGSAIQKARELLPQTASDCRHLAAELRKWVCLLVFKVCFRISYLSEMSDEVKSRPLLFYSHFHFELYSCKMLLVWFDLGSCPKSMEGLPLDSAGIRAEVFV